MIMPTPAHREVRLARVALQGGGAFCGIGEGDDHALPGRLSVGVFPLPVVGCETVPKVGSFSVFALNSPPQGGARAVCAGGARAPRRGAEAPQAPVLQSATQRQLLSLSF